MWALIKHGAIIHDKYTGAEWLIAEVSPESVDGVQQYDDVKKNNK